MGTALRSPNAALLDGLGRAGKYISVRKRQVIYWAGEQSDLVFLIAAGSVKLTVVSAEGNEAITAVLDFGELFGTEALGAPVVPRTAHAVALTNLRLVKLAPDLLMKMVLSDPAICALLISALVRQNMRSQDDLASSLVGNSEQRLARALLCMAEVGRTRKASSISSLSQTDLAHMIGTTRQRVNQLMKRFRNKRLIEDARGKHIHNSLQQDGQPDLMTEKKR